MFINVSNRKTSYHQNVLSVLKDKMKSPEVMTFSDFNKSILIHNEVSELGLGAVLYQQDERKFIAILLGLYHLQRKIIISIEEN